jgi:hypothetical protein
MVAVQNIEIISGQSESLFMEIIHLNRFLNYIIINL